ncbi:glycosyltransferase family 2 protein [Nostoc parmelioides]|uniref:Glycosyltransferase family 2 protein n=1 Tax=Nostoc parmelioides FACHB-3921 TaxID=2692909 RepID=A0ABR8BDX4_9NOSO|nr:glycosyltransferase family 2 protein [Nostoc parmelioides]MBD2251212.1 glycosyltransferase family 2 protein [Nostoc parmelioides FACHB-3921]
MDAASNVLVSIILVNYNGADVLPDCLNSIDKFIPKDNCEIVLVDNASQDNSYEFVAKDFPDVKIVRLPKNYGFGAGNNAGAKIAKGEFLLLLNTDTILTTNILPHLIDLMRENPDVGIIGTKLLFPDETFQVSFAYTVGIKGEYKSRRLHKYAEDKSKLNSLEQEFNTIKEVDIVVGAALFIRADLFHSLGGFDEKFFIYFEDADLCKRVQNQGYKILYTPQVSLIHIRGHSMKKNANATAMEYRRSQIYYYKKHCPLWEIILLKIYLLAKFVPEFLVTRNPYSLEIIKLLFVIA